MAKFNLSKVTADTLIQTKEGKERTENPENTSTCQSRGCLLYTSPSPRDRTRSRMPSSA